MSKSNKGSSYPNQGENRGTSGIGGKNTPRSSKSSNPKYGASVHKGKGKSNPPLPDWLE